MAHENLVRSAGSSGPVWSGWLPGMRVMVRLHLFGDPHHKYTDVIGVVRSIDEHTITLVPRSGEPVVVPLAQIAAGKQVPPAPPRRRPREEA